MPNLRRATIVLALCAVTAVLTVSCRRGSTQPTPVCTVSLAPATHTAPAEGATRTIAVATSTASCAWTAGTSVSWIGIPGNASGTGSGSVEYTIAPNTATEPRTGTVTVGSQVHSVTQDAATSPPPPPPASCAYALVPGSAAAGSSGGVDEFRVETTDDCNWTAVPGDAWLTIESGQQGTGDGTVRYRVAASAGSEPRTGTIAVADRTFTVRQSAVDTAACSYTVTPVELTTCMPAGSVMTRIETTASCPWTVTSNASWIALTSAESGSGSAEISLQYTSNYQAPREGFVLIRWPTETAGQNVIVQQAGCTYSTTTSAIAITAAGGTSSFGVLQQSLPTSCGGPLQDGCIWTATSTVPWITVTGSMPRSGDNPVSFTVAPNSSPDPRTGTIVVQERVVEITQAGQTP
jgi:hypothetical protein